MQQVAVHEPGAVTGARHGTRRRQSTMVTGESTLNRRQQALQDFVQRTKRGMYVHLPNWLVMALCVDMATTAPRTFWINCAGFFLETTLRIMVIRRAPALMQRDMTRAQRLFQCLVFIPCLHWSLLAVLSTLPGTLHPLMMPLVLIVTGLATAGTVVLSIDRTVRIWFPILALLPVGIGFLLSQPPPMSFLYAALDLFVIVYVSAATRVVYDDYWAALEARTQLEERANTLESLSNTDVLTQIPNRLYFERCLDQAWVQAARDQRPLSVLLIDLDHFKRINDTYGHSVGDECLRAAARAMVSGMLRAADRVARWGGEEFIVLLPNTDREAAQFIAQRLLKGIANTVIPYPAGVVHLACSIGVATVQPDGESKPKSLIDEADRALYEAKSQGRNRVVPAAA